MVLEILAKVDFLSPIFYQVLYMTVLGSIVGLIVYFIRNIFDKKISGKWKCIMWCIVLAVLLIPMRFEIKTDETSIIHNQIINRAEKIKEIASYEYIESELSEKQEQKSVTIENNDKNENEEVLEKNVPQISDLIKETDIKTIIINIIIPYIWLLGSFAFILVFCSGILKINRRISKNIYKDERLEGILCECKRELNINKNVKIILQKYKRVPSIYGIFKPSILITEKTLEEDDESIKYVFLHELAHYKRKDTIFNFILLCILSIHWFNPIIWFLFNKIRQDIEIGADELASKKLDKNQKKEYGMVLINLLKSRQEESYTANMLCMSDTAKNMERRIVMIKGKKKNVIFSFIIFSVIAVFIGGVVFIKFVSKENSTYKEQENTNIQTEIKMENIKTKNLKIIGGSGFSDGLARVSLERLEGVYIDKQGNIISIPYAIGYDFSDGLTMIHKSSAYGFADKNGNIVVDYIYEGAYPFSSGIAPVKKGGKWGYIDTKGNVVIDFTLEESQAGYFFEGLQTVYDEEKNKFGCIDIEGNVVIDYIYDWIGYFSEGLCCVEKDGKIGYIDKQGNVAVDFKFVPLDGGNYGFCDGLALVYDGTKEVFIDTQGNIVLVPQYVVCSNFCEGLCIVKKVDGEEYKYGFMDKQGNIVLDFQYDAVHSVFSEGVALVEKDGKCAFVDYNGNEVIGSFD